MIKSLRRKFITIAMTSIAVVLILIVGGINLSNYINIGKNVAGRIDVIAENGGDFPDMRDPENPPRREGKIKGAEAQYDTRYFSVFLQTDGTVISTNTGRIFAIDTKTASDYAVSLFEKGKKIGYLNTYRYTCFTQTEDSGREVLLFVFVDCERELNTFMDFAIGSVGISLIGLLLVFILVYLLSGIAIKPIVESYEKQKRFITDASHELKTPLTIIDANTEVIEMTNGESEWTGSIRKQVKRLASLTEKLVFLSRMDEENHKPEQLDFSLTDAVLDVVTPYEAVAKASGKVLTLDIATNITYCGCEKDLRQLVSLLLDNAMKYSNEGGNIAVSLSMNGKNRILTVYNTVEQIQPGKHDEFFERFYRADASHNSQMGGFGIGLSVASAIVTSHKGKITARSDDGSSIQFTVVL